MDFRGLAAAAEKIRDAGADVLGKVLDELNSAIPVIRALGFNITGLHLEAGVPPGMTAKLTGAVENVNVAKIEDLAQKNAENKVVVLLLKSLESAYNFKDQLKDLHFKGVEVDLTLGLSPKVNVGFLN
jgi:hypothetical protein